MNDIPTSRPVNNALICILHTLCVLFIFMAGFIGNSIIKNSGGGVFIQLLFYGLTVFSLVWLRSVLIKRKLTTVFTIRKGIQVTAGFLAVHIFFSAIGFLYSSEVPIGLYLSELFTMTFINVMMVAVMEEILLRYTILNIFLYRKMNLYVAVLFSSIIFALLHAAVYDLMTMAYVMVIGIGLAFLYLKFKNIGAAIGLHFTINYSVALTGSGDDTYQPQSFSELMSDNAVLNIYLAIIFIVWFIDLKKIRKRQSNHVVK